MLSPHLAPETLDRKYKRTTICKTILLVPKDIKTPDIRQVCTAEQPWHSHGTMDCFLANLAETSIPLVAFHLHWRPLLLTSMSNI